MQRESYGGRIIPNVKKVTLTKPKEKFVSKPWSLMG